MKITPNVNAAFINAIAEEGTKAEAVYHLQRIWNDLCELRGEVTDKNQEIGRLRSAMNWVIENPGAHPQNVVKVISDALNPQRGYFGGNPVHQDGFGDTRRKEQL